MSRRALLDSDRLIALGLGLGALLLYLRTLAPGVLDGDSGEWQYMASILGVAHSTGYPLYLLLAKLFTFLPVASPAWRVNFFSATCAALAVAITFFLGKRVSGSRIAAASAAALFAVAPALWASAVKAEVYALNSLLLSLTALFAVRWYQGKEPRDLCLMALTFGFALDNHRVAAFAVPGMLLLAWFMRSSLNLRRVSAAALLVLLPLALYAYIPIRASQFLAEQSPGNAELYPRPDAYLKGTVSAYYNHTPYGFFNLVTGFDNRNKLGFQDTSAADSLLGRTGNSAQLLLQQFNPMGLLLALAGIAILYRRDRRLALVLLAFGGGIAAISVTLHAESTRFYFSGAYLMLTLFVAAAAGWLVGYLERRPLLRAGLFGVLALLPLVNLGLNFGSVDMSGYNQYDLYSRTVLNDGLAENAVVIAPWELATPLRYFQFVEGVRPDLLIVHESPVRPQYQRIMTAAHALNRPFYYVQFTPEDKNASAPRTVQAVGLPLLARPSPQYPVDAALGDSIRVLGLDVSPHPGPDGQFLRVAVYYQVVAALGRQYKSDLEWNDIRGQPHGDWEHLPVTEYNRTDQWKVGDYYRDVWDVPLTADDPQGLYAPTLNWYTFDPETDVTNYDNPLSIDLPPVRVGDFSAGQIPQSQRAEFLNGMTLMGYGISGAGAGEKPVALNPGQTLDLSLYWSAARPLDSAYTIFVHLQDEKGAVRAQSDHAPWQGMFPTDRWLPGETVRDTYRLELPADLPAGEFSLAVGVYRTADQPIPLSAGGSSVMLDAPLVANRK